MASPSDEPQTPKRSRRRKSQTSPIEPPAGPSTLPTPSRPGLDVLVVLSFLLLTFLLGVFPLNDTDFWWHLRTGDLIRQTGQVPRTDPYLFGGPPNKTWTDLHWGFQVLVSLGYQLGGIDLLNLAKCAIITLSVAILLLARPRSWPIEVMALGALPALFLLAGRMYVRPEILSLLYFCIVVVICSSWKRWPRLAFLLPLVMLAWVNSQGLFVLGFAVMGAAVLVALAEPGRFAAGRPRWWRTIAIGIGLSLLACLINPYGLEGLLFPLHLLRTMGSPLFENIAELEPVYKLVIRAGWLNPGIVLLVATQALGLLSFLAPAIDNAIRRLPATEPVPEPAPVPVPATAAGKRPRKPRAEAPRAPSVQGWRSSLFRLILFLVFAALSWKASRNSQQFATVALFVTAWNLGEWVAARRLRRAGSTAAGLVPASAPAAKLGVVGLNLLLSVLVVSGTYYHWMGEGRTFGLGEAPFWFPHAAAEFAGSDGMPDRFVCVHNGHSAVWIYHNGPERKTFADARLEVIGPELYAEYQGFVRRLTEGSGWSEWLSQHGRPGLLIDLVQKSSPALVANVMADPGWRCVWFDPIAAVFVPRGTAAEFPTVDFARLHFQPQPGASGARSAEARLAEASAAHDVAAQLMGPLVDQAGNTVRPPRREQARELLLYARGLLEAGLPDGSSPFRLWKLIGQIDLLRAAVSTDPHAAPYRRPYDPVVDLEKLRAVAALTRALDLNPADFGAGFTLASLFQADQMGEAALPVFERLQGVWAINRLQGKVQEGLPARLAELRSKLGDPVAGSWKNLDELEARVAELLDRQRVRTAADLLESAYPVAGRPWDATDRIATLRARLGDASGARRVWGQGAEPPRPAVRKARLALTHLMDQDLAAARTLFEEALDLEPDLFEALYGLATTELDAGHAAAAQAACEKALSVAPGPGAASAVRELMAPLARNQDLAQSRHNVNP